MRHPVQPPAHRVNVAVNSHISTANAEAWRRHVESFGGSVELAFDALLTQLGPGLRLTRPKGFNNKFAKLRQKVEKVESTHNTFNADLDGDLCKLAASIDVARDQLNQAHSNLGTLRLNIVNLRNRLTSGATATAVAETVAQLETCDALLDSFDVAPN